MANPIITPVDEAIIGANDSLEIEIISNLNNIKLKTNFNKYFALENALAQGKRSSLSSRLSTSL